MGKAKREREKQVAPAQLTGTWTHAVRILLFSASIITAYLALATLAKGGQVPGCGPESDCEKVLTSSWAYWLGIPVSLLGLGLYGAFFFTSFSLKIGRVVDPIDGTVSFKQQKAQRALNTMTLISFCVLGAAVWFVGVQAVAIGAFCPYCCTAHALASLAALIFLSQTGKISSRLSVRMNFGGGISVALGSVAMIAVIQKIAPSTKSNWNEQLQEHAASNLAKSQINAPISVTKPAPIPKVAPPPTPVVEPEPATTTPLPPSTAKAKPFPIPKTNISLDASRLPLLGAADAPNRIGCLFDYTCHHCRQLHGFIRSTIDKFDGRLSCLMIPMPLDANCNAVIKRTGRDHVDACKYARICLAVQQIAPAKYDAFDRWLFSNHKTAKPLGKVREHAARLAGATALDKALSSPAVQQQLQQNIRVYELNSKNWQKSFMPQTIINDQVIFGPPPSAVALQSAIKQTLGLK